MAIREVPDRTAHHSGNHYREPIGQRQLTTCRRDLGEPAGVSDAWQRLRAPLAVQENASSAQTPEPLFSEDELQSLASHLRLSAREAQIIPCVLADRKLTAIARDLDMSPHTVHTHLERLYRKLGVGSRVGLTVAIFRCYLELIGNNRTHSILFTLIWSFSCGSCGLDTALD